MSRRRFSPRSLRGQGDEPFPLPPALAKLPSGDARLPREFVEQNQRNQIILAALSVFGEKGFAAATVQDLIAEAAVSRATYYRYFSDKEACLQATHAEVVGWLAEEALDAGRGGGGWADAVKAVSRRLLEIFAEDPRLVRLCVVEPLVAGAGVRARHDAALAELGAALREGRSEQPCGSALPPSLEALLVTGALSLTARIVIHGRPREAAALIDEIPEILLIPYLGSEAARTAVRGTA